MARSKRGQSPLSDNRHFVDLKCFAPDRHLISGVVAPAHGLLLRRPDKDLSVRVHDRRRGTLSGLFFSKEGGQREVSYLLRVRLLRPAQAYHLRRAIDRSKLPQSDPSEVYVFKRQFGPGGLELLFEAGERGLVPIPRIHDVSPTAGQDTRELQLTA